MPHVAAIIGASVFVAGTAILFNELILQPALEERRRRREDEEMEAAIQLSLRENYRWNDNTHDSGSGFGTSAINPFADEAPATLRRRHGRSQAYSDEDRPSWEQPDQRPSNANTGYHTPAASVASMPEMQERATSPTLTIRSPSHTARSLDDTGSLSDEEIHRLLSPPLDPDVPSANLQSNDTHSLSSLMDRAAIHESRPNSPSPTLRSISTETVFVDSRPASPFSMIDTESWSGSARARSANTSDAESAWSDLGEDSSSDEEGASRHGSIRLPDVHSPGSQYHAQA